MNRSSALLKWLASASLILVGVSFAMASIHPLPVGANGAVEPTSNSTSTCVPFGSSFPAEPVTNPQLLGLVAVNTEGSCVSYAADTALSVPVGNLDYWIFGDTPVFKRGPNGWKMVNFVKGSTLAVGPLVLDSNPTNLTQVGPKSGFHSFLPAAPITYLPDGSGRRCTGIPGVRYTARWPNGAVMMNSSTMLVTFVDECVNAAKVRGKENYTAEGWGIAEYNVLTGTFSKVSDVFPAQTSGAPLTRWFDSPVMNNGNVVLFYVSCPSRALSCAGSSSNTVSTVTLAPSQLTDPGSYIGHVLSTPADQPWKPMVQVDVVTDYRRNDFEMVVPNDLGGNYQIFRAVDPAGTWTYVSGGTLPGCTTPTWGFCYWFNAHPEISSTASITFLSYFLPNIVPSGHSVLAAVKS